MMEKIYVDEFLFLSLQKAPISASSENVLNSNLPPIGENIVIFSKKNVFSAHIRKNRHNWIKILVNIWNLGKNLQDLLGQNHCKNVGLMLHLAVNHDFHKLKLWVFFIILNVTILEKDHVKKHMYWRITLASPSLKTNPPHPLQWKDPPPKKNFFFDFLHIHSGKS